MISKLKRAVGLCFLAASANAGETLRASVDSSGNQGDDASGSPSISADGRWVAFGSMAANLAPDDANGASDVFVHDRSTGQTSCASLNPSGEPGDAASSDPAVSADGVFVAFASDAADLVLGDTNGCSDVFVHDRSTGQTFRVSVDSGGNQGDDLSQAPAISSDGRYVAFESKADNLVAGDANGFRDVFVHDRNTGQTSLVSLSTAGSQGNAASERPAISADGSYVAFASASPNLVTGDSNGQWDVFVRDLAANQTLRVSVDSAGIQGNAGSFVPSISADARFVAFHSSATNLVAGDTNGDEDAFVHDRTSGATIRVSVDTAGLQGNQPSSVPSLSSDGRFVAFRSHATNLVFGDTNGQPDAFVHDRVSGRTIRLSVSSEGDQGDGASLLLALSGDGRALSFDSFATDLVGADTNATWDVFVSEWWVGAAYCSGDGSGTSCPCGNAVEASGQGCANSTGAGGALIGTGSASAAADDLLLDTSHLPPMQPALLFAGTIAVNGGDGLQFGDGLRCAGGTVVRLGVHVANASGAAGWGPGLGALGGWSSGENRRFQVWYRNPSGGPCGSGFNLTNGLEVSFEP